MKYQQTTVDFMWIQYKFLVSSLIFGALRSQNFTDPQESAKILERMCSSRTSSMASSSSATGTFVPRSILQQQIVCCTYPRVKPRNANNPDAPTTSIGLAITCTATKMTCCTCRGVHNELIVTFTREGKVKSLEGNPDCWYGTSGTA